MSPYAGGHQLKVTRGWFVQTIKWRPTSIEAKKSTLSKQNHELVQRSKSWSDKAILVEISMSPVIKFNIKVA
jgi:hypothetical protein